MKTGLLLSYFTIGLALGGFYAGNIKSKQFISLKSLAFIQCALAVLLCLFMIGYHKGWQAGEFVLYCMNIIAGISGGGHFVIATRLSPQRAGMLYGTDLIGSAFGALAVSVYVVPFFGLLSVLNLIVILLVFTAIPLFYKNSILG